MSLNPFKLLSELGRKYGPAFVIVNQALGWISYIAIYVLLEYSDYDIVAYLTSYGSYLSFFKSSSSNTSATEPSTFEQLAKSGGPFALAFALNRLLTPIRLGLTLLLLPLTAEWINSFVNTCMIYFGYEPFVTASDSVESKTKMATDKKKDM